jgi:hypothetical protein
MTVAGGNLQNQHSDVVAKTCSSKLKSSSPLQIESPVGRAERILPGRVKLLSGFHAETRYIFALLALQK